MRVLLVEDDAMIGASVQKGLRQDAFSVDWVRDARSAEAALATHTYDVLLLDLGLPDKAGVDVLKSLRRNGGDLAVLIVTARDAVSDRVSGLDAGADDYIVKPFDLDELAARIRAVLRRRAGRADGVIEAGDVTLDPASRRVTLRGRDLALSARELALLEALLYRRGAILSRAQLEERIYGWGEEVGSNAVEVHVHALRRKLGADFIKTVRGVGYVIPQDR